MLTGLLPFKINPKEILISYLFNSTTGQHKLITKKTRWVFGQPEVMLKVRTWSHQYAHDLFVLKLDRTGKVLSISNNKYTNKG